MWKKKEDKLSFNDAVLIQAVMDEINVTRKMLKTGKVNGRVKIIGDKLYFYDISIETNDGHKIPDFLINFVIQYTKIEDAVQLLKKGGVKEIIIKDSEIRLKR